MLKASPRPVNPDIPFSSHLALSCTMAAELPAIRPRELALFCRIGRAGTRGSFDVPSPREVFFCTAHDQSLLGLIIGVSGAEGGLHGLFPSRDSFRCLIPDSIL